MPPTNLDEALAAVLQIPAVSQLYDEETERFYLESLLANNTGKLKVASALAYRIYATARSYLGSHPELRFVKTHDGTTIGDVDALLASLEEEQAKQDSQFFIPIIEGGTKVFSPFMSVSLRGSTEP